MTFANNRCEHATTRGDNKATVMLFGNHLIVSGNHVKAPRGVPSINLNSRPGTTLGNCTTGIIANFGTTIPVPMASFNVQNII